MFEEDIKVSTVLNDEYNNDNCESSKKNFEEILISEVERRPILWNFKMESRTSKAMNHAWNEVEKITGVNSFICASKWKKLRDLFIKRSRDSKKKLGIKKREKWKYSRHLQFLNSNVNLRAIKEKDRIKVEENMVFSEAEEEEERQKNMEAESSLKNVLPQKSRDKYEAIYEEFIEWMKTKGEQSVSEILMLEYFSEIAKKVKPTTLWSRYSMLKRTTSIHQNVDIAVYRKLNAFLKRQSIGFISKKSKVLTSADVTKFLKEAPDYEYLATKVALIFGVTGALRKGEFCDIRTSDITDHNSHLLITIQKNKNYSQRKFLVDGEFYYNIYKKYEALRPKNINTQRFFLNYINGKCTHQVIGINKFGSMPKKIAHYLNLPEPNLYTGHSFRRTSAFLLAGPGVNITTEKLPSGFKSNEFDKISKDSCELNKSGERNEAVNFGASTSQNLDSGVKSEYILPSTPPNLSFLSYGNDETYLIPQSTNFIHQNLNGLETSIKNSNEENPDSDFDNNMQIEIVKQEEEEKQESFCFLLEQRLAKFHSSIYQQVTQEILSVIEKWEKRQTWTKNY